MVSENWEGEQRTPGYATKEEFLIREALPPFVLRPKDLIELERLVYKDFSERALRSVEVVDRSRHISAPSVESLMVSDPPLLPLEVRVSAIEVHKNRVPAAVSVTLARSAMSRYFIVRSPDRTWALGRAAELREFFRRRSRWYWRLTEWPLLGALIVADAGIGGLALWIAWRRLGDFGLAFALAMPISIILAFVVGAWWSGRFPVGLVILTERRIGLVASRTGLIVGIGSMIVPVLLWLIDRFILSR